jgi:hypothetical protein
METSLREMLKKDEEERRELTDKLFARKKEITLLEGDLDFMMQDDLERSRRFRAKKEGKKEEETMINTLVEELKQKQLEELTTLQKDFQDQVSKMEEDLKLSVSEENEKIDMVKEDIANIHPTVDEKEKSLLDELSKLSNDTVKAEKDFNKAVSFMADGKLCRSSLECSVGQQVCDS